MNNSTNPTLDGPTTISATLIQELYISYISTLFDISLLTLLFYTAVLAIPREMKYLWPSPNSFSITTVFYVLTRYGSLVYQVLAVWLDNISPAPSYCDTLINVKNAASDVIYIGIQGLLILRAYSLCQGNKIITGALVFTFSAALGLSIYEDVAFRRSCVSSVNAEPEILADNIVTCLTDFLVFGVCTWRVWGTWKLKRDIGIQTYNDLVSVLLKQTVSRFGVAIIFTIVATILVALAPLSTTTSPVYFVASFQHSLTVILLADFVLDLRQQNSAEIQAVNLTLPTIEITSVMSYIHRSILVEMGDHENNHAGEGDGDGDSLPRPGGS